MLFKTQFRVTTFLEYHAHLLELVVSITIYNSSINVLDNSWQKHLKRNQIMEK